MTRPEQELFVYYRAAPQDGAVLAAAVRRMQAELMRQQRGLSARLLRRPDARDGLVTWMEAYAWPAGDDPAAVAGAVSAAAAALEDWIVGPRHVEHFVPCAS